LCIILRMSLNVNYLSSTCLEEARVEHMELKWNLDFTRQVITGSIDYDVVVGTPEAKSLVINVFYL